MAGKIENENEDDDEDGDADVDDNDDENKEEEEEEHKEVMTIQYIDIVKDVGNEVVEELNALNFTHVSSLNHTILSLYRALLNCHQFGPSLQLESI